jgi:hypothetical protein
MTDFQLRLTTALEKRTPFELFIADELCHIEKEQREREFLRSLKKGWTISRQIHMSHEPEFINII